MSVTLKCAACGAEVEFGELSPTVEERCPGCDVQVRYREGDEQMAIPVSMTLPEEFAHVDLNAVADKSSLLVGRYKKQAEEPASASTEVVLAKALATLANSIGQLEDRLNKHEQGPGSAALESEAESSAKEDAPSGEPVEGNGHSNGVKVVSANGSGSEGPEVVQLEPEEEEKFRGKSKANPVGARVLVRREAAREAHEFRREKHTQADWDDQAGPADRSGGFSWLMEHYPKTTVFVTMLFAAALITATILWMDELFSNKVPIVVESIPEVRVTGLGKLMEQDPEAALAETVARAFLNATSAETAGPFVFESESIEDKFKKYYKPISQPGAYELSFKQRALAEDGKTQFLYRVDIPGEKARLLIVLPEGAMPKVFWEHFSEVGEMSWDAFFRSKPKEPVEMRVWVYPTEIYSDGYNSSEWQSYMLHDYAEKRKILAYADRGAGDDWQISDALENEPVQFGTHSAIMALVKLTYMTEFKSPEESVAVAQIDDLVATSWLPERFRAPRPKKK